LSKFSVLIAFLAVSLVPSIGIAQQTVSLGDAAENAVKQSKLIVSGGTPFHLKARIVETTNPDSDYKADIEVYWVSTDKWRRTIQSPDFSQTTIVNGDAVEEENKGDYYPWWLKDLVTAVLDPIPMTDSLKQVNAQLRKPADHSSSCATVSSLEFGHLTFCFQDSRGLVQRIGVPWYEANFEDYKDFHGKQVARKIVIDPEPGTTIQATIYELAELSNPSEEMFMVQAPTPIAQRIRATTIQESVARPMLLNSPEINWPSVGGGLTKGRMAIFISVDRTGHVRETWPHGSDNADLMDPAREQVSKWKFKPGAIGGVPVQFETLLTFTFDTTIDKAKAKPVLTEDEARKLATQTVEPQFPPSVTRGSDVKISVAVGEDGKVAGASNVAKVPDQAFLSAYGAVVKWTFKPYMLNGKPTAFDVVLTFHVK
jgi:outer membrane biosynthesis protein TonB